VDLDSGIATIEGSPQAAATYERAVSGVVAGRPLRRAIEAVARIVSGRKESGSTNA
jgi:hypothetical protein